jgi:hypothetical protein
MTVAPVPLASVFRETSIFFAVSIGMVFFRERLNLARLASVTETRPQRRSLRPASRGCRASLVQLAFHKGPLREIQSPISEPFRASDKAISDRGYIE